MDLTSVEAVRRYGFFDSGRDDLLIAALITAASRAIESYCRRSFRADTATDRAFRDRSSAGIASPFRGSVLLLDSELAEAATAITGTPSVTYMPENDPPYYSICNEDGAWAPPITVTGYWAYTRVPPADIELGAMRMTKWLYELRQTTRGDGVVVTDQGAVLLPAALPADVLALIEPYRRRVIVG